MAGSPPSRLYERMGKSEGVRRSISMSRSGGSAPCTWLTRARTSWSAYAMSVAGEKLIDNSLAPRIECDCTRVTPGTTLTASSSGRVTLNTTWRAPRLDLGDGIAPGAALHGARARHPARVDDEDLEPVPVRDQGGERHGDRPRALGRHDSADHRLADPERACRAAQLGADGHGARRRIEGGGDPGHTPLPQPAAATVRHDGNGVAAGNLRRVGGRHAEQDLG